jgi:hypothetical protein
MARRRRHDAQTRMIEHSALAGVLGGRDVDACLVVQPPTRQPQLACYLQSFLVNDAVGHVEGVDIPGHAFRVICQRDGGASDHEYVGERRRARQAAHQGA